MQVQRMNSRIQWFITQWVVGIWLDDHLEIVPAFRHMPLLTSPGRCLFDSDEEKSTPTFCSWYRFDCILCSSSNHSFYSLSVGVCHHHCRYVKFFEAGATLAGRTSMLLPFAQSWQVVSKEGAQLSFDGHFLPVGKTKSSLSSERHK